MSVVQKSWLSREEVAEAIAAGRQRARSKGGQRPLSAGRFGDTPGRNLGAGLDYADSRPMAQGDDPRHINWRATARQGGGEAALQPLVRQFHPEFNRQRVLALDARQPMWFASRGRLKLSQALRVALALAAMCMESGDDPGLLLLEGSGAQWFAPGTISAQQILGRLSALAGQPCEPPQFDQAGSLVPVWALMGQLPRQLTSGAELFVLSEQLGLFQELDAGGEALAPVVGAELGAVSGPISGPSSGPVLASVRALARQFDLHVIELLDPLDQHLPEAGRVNLKSGDVSRIWRSNKASERSRYQKERARILESARGLLRSVGVNLQVLETGADALDSVRFP